MTTAILSTLIGGLLALVGAFLGPFLQRKHDRWLALRADQKLLRDKAEELFMHLNEMSEQSGRATLRIVERMSDPSLDAVPIPDLGAVRALATIYFPAILPLVDELQIKQKEINHRILPKFTGSRLAEASEIQALGVILVMEHQDATAEFVRKVHSEMRTVSPSFEKL